MALPKFNETLLPLLDLLKDGRILTTGELARLLLEKNYFSLNNEELNQKLESGGNTFINRVAWGKLYLKKAGFIEQPQKGTVKISETGLRLLNSGINTISGSEIRKIINLKNNGGVEVSTDLIEDEEKALSSYSPEDLINLGFKSLKNKLKEDLKEKLTKVDPYYFEKIILKLLKQMGYGEFETTPKSNDGGIDGIISQDPLGLDKVYIQAKRFNKSQVRELEIRNFIGAMSSDVEKGIFVTTSTFEKSAIEKAQNDNHKIVLIDGNQLIELMIKYNIGTQIVKTIEFKQIDEDFFEQF